MLIVCVLENVMFFYRHKNNQYSFKRYLSCDVCSEISERFLIGIAQVSLKQTCLSFIKQDHTSPPMISKTVFWLPYLATFILYIYNHPVYGHGVSIQAHQYINRYRDLAIAEMYRTGIPASIKLAQGMFESQNGNSNLATQANNHFGIKCKEDWQGDTMLYDDDAPQECFRKYSSAEDSFIDHSNILQQRDRYLDLFKLSPTDYKGWAKGLKKAGYATLDTYDSKIIGIIEQFQLYEYDLGGQPDLQIAEQLSKGEASTFVAHAKPKSGKPKRSLEPSADSDLASIDRALNRSLAQRPNIPLQQLGGAPAIMPIAGEINKVGGRKQHRKHDEPSAPRKPQNTADVAALPVPVRPYTSSPVLAKMDMPTPPADPTPDYMLPKYEHQTVIIAPDIAINSGDTSSLNPYIIPVTERATAPAPKLLAADITAARRRESPLLPPQKFNYVNDTKTVTYPYDVSVAQIAKTYHLSLEQVLKYNDLKDETSPLPARQNVFLQPKSNKSDQKTHLVATGETLWSIAQKYGISLLALCQKNKVTPNVKPLVGERLYLKAEASKAPRFGH